MYDSDGRYIIRLIEVNFCLADFVLRISIKSVYQSLKEPTFWAAISSISLVCNMAIGSVGFTK